MRMRLVPRPSGCFLSASNRACPAPTSHRCRGEAGLALAPHAPRGRGTRLWEAGVQREQSESRRIRAARRPKSADGTRGRPGRPRSERRRDPPPRPRKPREAVRNLRDNSTRRSSRGRHGARSCPIFGSSRLWSLCSTAYRSSAPGARRAEVDRNRTGWREAVLEALPQRSATYSSRGG